MNKKKLKYYLPTPYGDQNAYLYTFTPSAEQSITLELVASTNDFTIKP